MSSNKPTNEGLPSTTNKHSSPTPDELFDIFGDMDSETSHPIRPEAINDLQSTAATHQSETHQPSVYELSLLASMHPSTPNPMSNNTNNPAPTGPHNTVTTALFRPLNALDNSFASLKPGINAMETMVKEKIKQMPEDGRDGKEAQRQFLALKTMVLECEFGGVEVEACYHGKLEGVGLRAKAGKGVLGQES